MAVPVFSHPDCLVHDPGPGHPESPARLRVLLDRLAREPLADVREAPLVDPSLVAQVHDRAYLDQLVRMAAAGGGALDPDTTMSRGSLEAARRSAGGAVAAVETALATGGTAFSAGRPPGHHALANAAMGFCLLANAVLSAAHARACGVDRVLIVDWDVHHGNGTQALIQHDTAVRFVSMHQWPWWPGTGNAEERGVGNIWNVPMPAGLPPERYVEAFWDHVALATDGWRPGLVIVSAGFDCLRGDPLGGFTLEPDHLADLTRRLRELPGHPPLTGLLEGGYIPDRVAEGVMAHLGALA